MLLAARLLSKWIFVILISLFLQSCCVLGGQKGSTSKGQWQPKENTNYSSVTGAVQFEICTKITRQRCADEYTETCKTITDGKQLKAINPSTGEDISVAANDMYKEQCAKLKEDPKQIDNYCETHTNNACMEENGFVYKYYDVSQCSPMKLF